MTKQNKRRHFLEMAGTTGMAGILASHQAPAFAQGTNLHWLRWNDFVPAGDRHTVQQRQHPQRPRCIGFCSGSQLCCAGAR